MNSTNSSVAINGSELSNSSGVTNSSQVPKAPAYVYVNIEELDITFGTFYLLFGLFGIYSNGSILWQFCKRRKTIKVYPFTLSALVLAANDLLLCTLGVSPYAILILAKRPVQESFPNFLCKIFGFVYNFCNRFAWFDITSIMVFRCITMAFPLKLRNITYHPFVIILSLLALLQGIICIFPFFDWSLIMRKYYYVPNLGECSYAFNTTAAGGMMVVVDVLWWGPFVACVLSCALFFVFMKIHAAKMNSLKSEKNNEAKRKTALLTAFFVVCYLPKALLILFDYLLSSNKFFGHGWEWFAKALGDPKKTLCLYIYLSLVCKFIAPAGRAAFTPTVLRLKEYIKRCDTSRRNKTANQHPHSTFRSSVTAAFSVAKSKLFKDDSASLLDGNCDKKNKTDFRGEKSQFV